MKPCNRNKRVPESSKEVMAGSRVRLKGLKGWYIVRTISGNQISCTRRKGDEISQTWTDFDQVVAVSNKKTKGNRV